MKHVTGLANDSGTRIASTALSRVQARMSGVVWIEQIRIRAVSIERSFAVRLQVPEGPSKECAIAHTRSRFSHAVRSRRDRLGRESPDTLILTLAGVACPHPLDQ